MDSSAMIFGKVTSDALRIRFASSRRSSMISVPCRVTSTGMPISLNSLSSYVLFSFSSAGSSLIQGGQSVPQMLTAMIFVDFNVVWRYFAWTNQTLAVFTLWTGTVWLYRHEAKIHDNPYRFGYLIALIPALFMTMVCSSYILIAPEGLNIAPEYRWGGYLIAGIVTLGCLLGFHIWARNLKNAK